MPVNVCEVFSFLLSVIQLYCMSGEKMEGACIYSTCSTLYSVCIVRFASSLFSLSLSIPLSGCLVIHVCDT